MLPGRDAVANAEFHPPAGLLALGQVLGYFALELLRGQLCLHAAGVDIPARKPGIAVRQKFAVLVNLQQLQEPHWVRYPLIDLNPYWNSVLPEPQFQ